MYAIAYLDAWFMISCDSSEHPPFLSPSSTFTGHSSGGCWVIVPRGTSSGAQQLSTAVSAMLGWVRPLSWSLAGFDPSLVTDKQRTTWPRQADTDKQTNSFAYTHSAGDRQSNVWVQSFRHEDSKGTTMWIQYQCHLSLSISLNL